VPPSPFSFPSISHVGSRVWSADLADHIGERVVLRGWLHHRRALKSVLFLVLRDASGTAQVVIETPADRAIAESLPHESVIAVTGRVIASAQASAGVEIHDPSIAIISRAAGEPGIELFRPELSASLPTRLDHAAVSLRHPRRARTQRLAAGIVEGFRSSLRDQGFVEIATPKIVGSAPEGGSNVFSLDYFGRDAYLAQSPQLYKQMMVGALERVFETAPAFRAEPHDTSRHVSQFLSLDAELGFIDDHFTVMGVLADTIRSMVEAAGPFADLLAGELPAVPSSIPDIHFTDALALIGKATGEDVQQEPDLAPAHERWLGAWAKERYGSDWLFVTGYPMAKRPFYTHPDPARPEWSNSFDLLFRGLEVVTGGQRLHHHDDYLAALAARGIDPEPFAGYLDAFRFGMPPHGGFALGLERFVAQLSGIANIRDVVLFPRDMQRLTP
jgi:nondiscriminating aspartyl-tRNA synthetase